MFTTASRPQIEDHRFELGQPKPEIIDYRLTEPRDGRWSTDQPDGHKTYESIIQQLESAIASEKGLKKRIKELETDNGKLLEVYEAINTENAVLKSHMKHGPQAQKIKQLEKYVKELNDELEAKEENNILLMNRLKDVEKLGIEIKDLYVEKNWHLSLEKARKRREEKDANVGTQGPFKEGNQKRKTIKHVDEEIFESQDSRDLIIDNLEKETLILLNKVRLLKQNKEEIDYANFIDKGALTRNKVIKDAINDKLDRDLENFANRLNALQQKAAKLRVRSRGSDVVPVPSKSPKSPKTNEVEEKQKLYTHKVKPKNTSKPDSGTSERKLSRKSEREVKINLTTPDDKPDVTSKPSSGVSDRRTPGKSIRVTNELTPSISRASSESLEPVDRTNQHRRGESVPGSSVHRKPINVETSKSVTPSTVDRSGSPIENHWGNLSEKLIKTEKYGNGKTGRQPSHRDTKSVISGRPTANSTKVNKESNNKSSNVVSKSDALNNTDNLAIHADTDNPYQPRVTYNGMASSKNNIRLHGAMQPDPIRFVSAQRGRFTNGPEPISRGQDKPAKWKRSKETKNENSTGEQHTDTNTTDNDKEVVTVRRDVSAYDAIIADLHKQHENQEKELRTARNSQLPSYKKSILDSKPYKGAFDNEFNEQIYSPTKLEMGTGVNRRQHSFSRQSTTTLDLL